jgi:hypothetical protein
VRHAIDNIATPISPTNDMRREAAPRTHFACYGAGRGRVSSDTEAWEALMRRVWIGVGLNVALYSAVIGTLALAASNPAMAQARKTYPTNPDLDTDDQLAPSQMKQPIPGAVAEPTGGGNASGNAVTHAPAQASTAPPAHPAVRARPAPVASGHTVTCGGTFAKDSSHLKLAMTFDSKNITFTDVDASNGTKVPASVLFPSDPKRRLEVWWSNQAARSGTYLIVINGKSIWTAPGGLRLGLTVAQLEKLNKKAFKLKGFDKDGVATVSDWDGGELANLPGGCKSGLSLRADPKSPADAVSALSPDKEYNSQDPEVLAVKPTVSEVLIGY